MIDRPSTGLLVLLGFVPVAIALHFLAPERHLWIFFASVLAILTLRTHRGLYGPQGGDEHKENPAANRGSTVPAIVMLLGATIGVAIVSELLVGTVTKAAQDLGMSQLFVGVVVVALVGNAAEHYSAVVLAVNDQMDAAIAIAVGSSTQIALFVAPLLVFISHIVGPQPMDLLFTVFELVAIGLALLSIAFISHDGETHWMEGVQLLAVYVIIALGFYYLPAP